MIPGSKFAAATAFAATTVIALLIAGCQHAPTTAGATSTSTWRVLERVGDVRAAALHEGPGTRPLGPGDIVAADHQITVSRGGLLILAKDGVQLTAGENASFRLPASSASSSLFLDRGRFRLRLAMAADRETRISTAHFGVSASNATLTLRADRQGSELSMEGGTAALATIDGRHHASLVAGAAARVSAASGGDLLIRPASGRAFAKVAPLPAAPERPASEGSRTPPERLAKKTPSQPPRPVEQPSRPTPRSTEAPAKQPLAIRPASRPRTDDAPSPKPIVDTVPLSTPPLPVRQQVVVSKSSERQPTTGGAGRSSISAEKEVPKPASLPRSRDEFREPVQTQFDRLTEGLIDGL